MLGALQPAVGGGDGTLVAEFPIDAGEGVRTLDDVGMWEQLGLAAFLQRHWADNQARCACMTSPCPIPP